jgi:hypothetical protein
MNRHCSTRGIPRTHAILWLPSGCLRRGFGECVLGTSPRVIPPPCVRHGTQVSDVSEMSDDVSEVRVRVR